MKFTATLMTACVLCLTNGARADSLACAGQSHPAVSSRNYSAPAIPPAPAKSPAGPKRNALRRRGASGKTVYAYYAPPAGYAFDPASARGVVSDGRGTHGVDASIAADKTLCCLWAAAGNGSFDAGYCEVKARRVGAQR